MKYKHVKDGSVLARALELDVNEGRFHIDGTFYQRPSQFPCAFFDLSGYLIVGGVDELLQFADLGEEKVNMKLPVSSYKQYFKDANAEAWPGLEAQQRDKEKRIRDIDKLLSAMSIEERESLLRSLEDKQ